MGFGTVQREKTSVLGLGQGAAGTGIGMGGGGFTMSGGMGGGMGMTGGQVQESTVGVKFQSHRDQDGGGGNSATQINLQTITARPEFREKSLEELRFNDYQLKKQGRCDFKVGAQKLQ